MMMRRHATMEGDIEARKMGLNNVTHRSGPGMFYSLLLPLDALKLLR